MTMSKTMTLRKTRLLSLKYLTRYEKVYSNMPTDTHMLKPVANCEHCDAKRFEHEPPAFCCRSGKVDLNEPNIPDELMRLWSSNDADARHFRNSIRFFNGHFSFTSLYCRLDSATASMKNSGIYTLAPFLADFSPSPPLLHP